MVLENEQEPSSSPRAALQSTPASSRMSTIRPITSTPDVKMVGNDEGEDGEDCPQAFTSSGRASDLDTFFLSDDDEVEIRAKGGSSTRRKLLSSRPSADDDTGSRPSFPSALSSNNFLTGTEQSAQNSKKGKKASEYCYSFLVDRRDVGSFITLMCKPFSPIPSFAFLERWKGKFFEHLAFDLGDYSTRLGQKLTDRVKMKMVGVPEMSFDFWAAKGYKVGRVDQTETSLGAEMCATKKGGAKDIVRRRCIAALVSSQIESPTQGQTLIRALEFLESLRIVWADTLAPAEVQIHFYKNVKGSSCLLRGVSFSLKVPSLLMVCVKQQLAEETYYVLKVAAPTDHRNDVDHAETVGFSA
ncbi:hypothetical protein BS47DRAFT_1368219 [Hydnum rufescens UP504]|uniref:DNA mismatch repair protein MutS-like N-terminal domain-containing protein n=1 Tax=Hydnum rufescens UP504 TaxID=1448309 RepID=A0A9P6AGM3_9AGAM|nr:hypothetical protein BS47DRAFT_1368219 [Hydnum rufescens UP504]